MLGEVLSSEMENAGFKMKIFEAGHLDEIRNDFEDLVNNGFLDKDFYRNSLSHFKYEYKNVMENAKYVILVAAPQYKSIVKFKTESGEIPAVIPPTYNYPSIDKRITDILSTFHAKNNCRLARISLPMKLLAVRSGLGQYGRNNICYIPGSGSFNRLLAFITDCCLGEDSWGGISTMKSCEACSACVDSCPTGAVGTGQFLINALKCITNYNEELDPIPGWMDPGCHNAIVGCMKCQSACPHNAGLIDMTDEEIFFDTLETHLILDGAEFGSLPAETRSKISSIGMEPYYSLLPRNINLLKPITG